MSSLLGYWKRKTAGFICGKLPSYLIKSKLSVVVTTVDVCTEKLFVTLACILWR